MALNTRIRGKQINLSDEALDVAVDSLAFKDADEAIKVDTIADLATAMAGDGLEADSGVFAIDLKANDGLKIDTAELTVDYDDSTIGIITNQLAVKDDGITEPKLAMNNAPVAGKVIAWNAGEYMEWVDPDVNAVYNTDIAFENESANCDGGTTDFTIDNTPIANSVQVFLNGLLQEEGSGKDYTLSGTTISFTTAPQSGWILLIHYIISD